MTQLEILPPHGAAAASTPADLVRRLAKMFPKHAGELLEWLPAYQRALAYLPPQRLAEMFEATMAAWTRSSPPKPGDFAAAAPSAASVEAGRSDTGALSVGGRLTRAGFVEAKRIAARMIEDALRDAPEPLEGQEAWRLASGLRDRAWMAAQWQLLGERYETIEITPADVARVRAGIVADTTHPELVRYARGGAFGRASAPEPSARMRERLASLARARDAEPAPQP